MAQVTMSARAAQRIGEILRREGNGVMLRVSGERSPKGLSTNENWSPLRYEFDVHGIANTELVAEFRGDQGSGAFDIERFKLVRKGKVSETKVEEP